jgi:hypothetical protein
LIERHEDAARWSLIGGVGLGLFSLVALIRFRRRDLPRTPGVLLLAAGFVIAAVME